jgi:uncharacterized glyoxalase superfamily protein PhnB
MSDNSVPDGYHTVTPYIVVQDAAGLIEFITSAFGGKERMRMAGEDGSIMHAEVEIGDSVVMIGGASGEFPPKNAMLHIYTADVDALYQQAISAGAESKREPANQEYGDRSAGVSDRWGNEWWLATHIKDA